MVDDKLTLHKTEINNEDIAVCTAVSKNYLAFARVLSKSLREQHPSIRIFVLLVDHLEGAFDPDKEPFELIEIEDLDNIPEPKNFFFKYKPIELNTAAKPYLFEYLFRKYGFTKLIFLDPDILVLDSLNTILDLLNSNNIILTPHITEPYMDDRYPDEKHILQSGIFNLGFIAMANTSVTNDFLKWWQTRLYDFCFMDISQGMHVDQNWVNFAPAMFEGVHILKDPAYNIAYWNLHSRGQAITFEKGKWNIHGKPIVFFHFSGLNIDNLEKISVHQNRFTLNNLPNLRPLFELYRNELLTNGHKECSKWRYAYGYFDNGIAITEFIRKLYNSATKSGNYFSNPFSTSHSQSFFNWLNQSIDTEKVSGDLSITRLMAFIYSNRIDIKFVYPRPQGTDRRAFVQWFKTFGKREYKLDDSFIPGTERFQVSASHIDSPEVPENRHVKKFSSVLRDKKGEEKLPIGVNYAGYFKGEFGVAVAARNYIYALQTTQIPYVLNNIIAGEHRHNDRSFQEFSDDNPFFINIIHVNADQAKVLRNMKGSKYYKERYNVGFWVWELEKFPEKWLSSFQYYQEIWVPSEFCKQSIASVSPVPVTKIKHPIILVEKAIHPNRSQFLIPEDEFVFLFVFDYLSVFERKNPLGMIRAFQKSFRKEDKVSLIIKSINSNQAPEKAAYIQTITDGYNIRFIDRHLDPEDMLSLMASVDSFVSLHRSEGFGLGMAQSMYLGKPVIATAYSGNMDFMKPSNSFLVDYKLVELEKDYGPYEKGNVWAEPDVDHAAELMRTVYEDRPLAEKKAQQAAWDIRMELSPQAIGAEMQARIKQIYEGKVLSYQKPTEVSIIIPVFNRLELTRQCLDTIRQTAGTIPYEIIVVDNGSNDGTTDYLRQEETAGRLKAIINNTNLGFAMACNQGAKAAKGKFLLFLNNDTIPQPEWLDEMLRTAESDKRIGIVGSKLLFPDRKIQHAGVVVWKNKRPYHIYKDCPADLPAANIQRDYQIVTAACMLVRKEIFDNVGGFDERYFNGLEDVDLCLKFGQRNKRVVYNPKSVVIHLESQTEGRQDYMNANRMLFEQTWRDKIKQDDFLYLKQDGMEAMVDLKGSFYFVSKEEIKQIRVSIVIVSYNSASTIRACLDSVLQYTPNAEVIVVDNASADGTPSVLSEYEGRITSILNKENKGFSFACNQGIRASKGEYIILLNPDTAVTPMWKERLISHFQPGVGAVGPLSNYTNEMQLSKYYTRDANWDRITSFNERAEKLHEWNRGQGRETNLLMGFCLALPRKVLNEVGLLDEDLFLGSEDLEISWRLRQKGYKLIIAVDTFVYHKGQVSFKSQKTSTSDLTQESADKLYAKLEAHYGTGNVPHPMELWGIDYFKPSKAQFRPLLPPAGDQPSSFETWWSDTRQSVYSKSSGQSDRTIPVQTDNTWLVKDLDIRQVPGSSRIEINGVQGELGLGDVRYLFDKTKAVPEGSVIVEIGSFMGLSAIVMAHGLIASGNYNTRIYCVDTWEGSPEHQGLEVIKKKQLYDIFMSNILKSGVKPLIHPIRKRSTEASRDFQEQSIDLLFIDGDHSFESCYTDLKAWYPKLKPGGILIGHDCVPGGGVHQAVEKFSKEYGFHYSVVEPPAAHFIFELHTHTRRYEQKQPPFAAVYCVYDDNTWLKESIESIYHAVDAVYFLISDRPWHGQSVDNAPTLECIRTFPDPLKKINIVRGDWTNETDQRNAGLDILKEKGFTYCFVIDADEIYDSAELKRMMDLVVSHPEVECWHMTWDTYWKSYKYRIEPREPFTPVVFVKVGAALFIRNRDVDTQSHVLIPPEIGICHHLSYARRDEEVLKKITTFSHAREVQPGWFENVWKKWDSDHSLTNLHPTHPQCYQRAVEQQLSALPPVLKRRYLADEKTGGGMTPGLTSIIILAHNQWDQTELCLKSIEQHTPEPHEIILVDNGSTDETGERLQALIKESTNKTPSPLPSPTKGEGISIGSPPLRGGDEGEGFTNNPFNNIKPMPNLKVISNKTNRGFAAGNNQGISIARGEYILLLNNDTIVTSGWLGHMIDVFQHYPKAGIVGPMSNNVTRPQVIEKVDYEDIHGINDFAWKWAKEHEAQSFPTSKASGFCLLAKRKVIDTIGGLDEQFGSGNFEDDDFCNRAFLAGFEIRIAQDVFIHHTGRQTFKTAGIDYNANLLRNWELYKAKWDIPKETALESYWIPSHLPKSVSPYVPLPDVSSDHTVNQENRWWEDIGRTEKEKVKVQGKQKIKSLTSIVILLSGQQEYTRKCVQSIQRYTKEPYEIIFVPANASYSPAKWLRKLIKENSNYKLAKVIPPNYPLEMGGKGLLSERDKTLSFSKACNLGIHESSGEYILILNDAVVVTEDWLTGMLECLNSSSDTSIVGPLTVNVEGPQSVPGYEHTSIENLEAFARDFRERNRYRRVHVKNLDSFCILFRYELTEKIGFFDDRFELYEYADDDYCFRAAVEGFGNLIAGDVFVYFHGYKIAVYDRQDSPSALIKDKRIFGEKWGHLTEFTPESKKGLSTNIYYLADELLQKGQKENAVVSLVEGIKSCPGDERLHHALAQILIEDGKFKESLDILEHIPEEMKKGVKTLELIGLCKEGMGLLTEAEHYADEVLRLNSASPKAWNLKGTLSFRRLLFVDAERFFDKARESDRGFGEAYANLGALRWQHGKKEEALRFFEQAFILSPIYEDIVTNFYSAAVNLSRLREAEKTFREAIVLYPFNRRLKFILIDNLLQQKKFPEAMKEMEEAMIIFGTDDDTLGIALKLRDMIGPVEIDKTSGVKITLCMIVKNEEKHIAQALQSTKPVVDEMIVVDTGSTDRTKQIAKAFGAKVYDFAWRDDFSAARNFSLLKASGDWIFILDADEVISPADYGKLRDLVKQSGARQFAYSVVSRNYVGPVSVNWHPNDGKYKEEAGSGWFPSAKVRLFPNDSRVRFERPVHEIVEDSLMRIGIELRNCDIPIHHYGKLSREEILSKGEEYYQLGKKKLAERGEYDPNALYELAIQASELEKYDEALEYWTKLTWVKPDFAKAYHGMGTCYFKLGKYDEALSAYKKALHLDPDFKDPVVMYATSELLTGNANAAISHLDELLRKERDYPLALLAITAAYFCVGRKDKGLEYIRKVEKTQFNIAPYLTDIAKLLSRVKRFEYAVRLLEAAVETGNTTDETRQLLDECYRLQKDSSEDLKKNYLTTQTLESPNPQSNLSLCMIVKDEEENIERSLMSAKHVVDEMIVVDTGSTDRTKAIAERLGAKVYDFPWTWNFSDARNFAISKAAGNWILILDADEVISFLDHDGLRKLLKNTDGKPVAYSFMTRNYVIEANITGWIANDGKYFLEEEGTGWFPGEKVRMFPKDIRIQFEFPVHERVEPSLMRAGIEIRKSGIPVHHYGKLNREKALSKAESYYLLAKKKLAETGEKDAMALYELALQGAEIGRYEETLEYLKKVTELKLDFPKVYQSMGNAYYNLGRYEEALSSYKKAYELNPDSRDSVLMYATCRILIGNAEEAISLLENLIRNDPTYPQAVLLLSESYFCAGRKEKGLEYIKKLRDTNFNFGNHFTDFAKILISVKRLDYAVSLLEATVETNNINNDTHALLAECRKMLKKHDAI